MRRSEAEEADTDADVLIVGYGPVGQCLAALLGRAGHRVIVLERRSGRYETPRAGHFDHEIMRVFQSMAVADAVAEIADPALLYEFLEPDGTVIARLNRQWAAPSGWHASYHFYQPELETVLDSAAAALPAVQVRFDTTVTGVREADGRVFATVHHGDELTARFLVAADGANSVIRQLVGIPSEDLGFQADWLVVDVKPLPGAPIPSVPDSGQVMDHRRPTFAGRAAERYFRWEFMLIDGDDPDRMVQSDRVWELLAPWTDPSRAELIRQRVYRFRSIVAETFRHRSILLVGDAAHVMPPFLGQGMSSGIRDAATLSWLLDLVLRGAAESNLLDLYTASRRPQVMAYVRESMRIGTMVSETDPERAEAQRQALRSATTLPPPFQPPIGAGFTADDPLAGRLAIQPTLRLADGTVGRSDDLLGCGLTLFATGDLDDAARALVAQLEAEVGLRCLVLGIDAVEHQGESLGAWMREAGVVAVLVRPDFYVFGTASESTAVAGLLGELRDMVRRPAA